MRRLVGALLLFMWAASACTRGQTMPAVPANVVADGWQGARLQTLCLEVRQSFPEIAPGFTLPVEPALRRLLPRLGIRVAASGEECDGALSVKLQGQALAADYVCILGKACGHCFTGARVGGELTLTRPDRTPWVRTVEAGIAPPSSISDCPKVAKEAPLDSVWPRAVLDGLVELWGTPALAAAIGDQETTVRKGAVRLLATQGKEGIPILVLALRDKSADVRARAADALGSQGALAGEAVPALVEVLDDGDRPVRLAAASALQAITGQGFGQDQGTWRKWLKDPNVTPAPFTSWKGVPIRPDASSHEELGSMLQYVVQVNCGNVAAFYQAEMPGAGWTPIESARPGGFSQQLTFKKGRDTAEVHLNDTPVAMGQSRCSVQIFLLR